MPFSEKISSSVASNGATLRHDTDNQLILRVAAISRKSHLAVMIKINLKL